MNEELNTLLSRHFREPLPREQNARLHKLLKSQNYAYGDFLPDHPCPHCERPLKFTFLLGPVCLHADGGCGQACAYR